MIQWCMRTTHIHMCGKRFRLQPAINFFKKIRMSSYREFSLGENPRKHHENIATILDHSCCMEHTYALMNHVKFMNHVFICVSNGPINLMLILSVSYSPTTLAR